MSMPYYVSLSSGQSMCVYVNYCKMANSEDEGEKPQKGHDNKSCPICGHGPYKDGRSVHMHITRYH